MKKVTLSMKFGIAILFMLMISLTFANNMKAEAAITNITVAVQPNNPPYQFMEDGRFKGLHIDLLNHIAEKNNFNISYVYVDTLTKGFESLESGDVDMILGTIENANRKSNIKYSNSISMSSVIMAAGNETAQKIEDNIKNVYLTTTFEINTIDYSMITNMTNLNYIVVSNQERAFNNLINNNVDTFIGDKNSFMYLRNKAYLENKYKIVNNYISTLDYTLATLNINKDLLHKINDAIYQLKITGEYEEIYRRWINEDDFIIRDTIKKFIKYLSAAIMIVASIIALNIRMNMILKKQVNEKTKELVIKNSDLQVQIEETRNISEVRNRIVEDSSNAIVVFNLDYNITLFNKSAIEMTGFTDNPLGKNVFEIDLLNSILSNKKDNIFNHGFKDEFKDISIKNSQNEEMTYRYDIYQLFSGSKEVRGAILSIKDITLVRRDRNQLIEKEKSKALNQMIASIAHEIRNPLMSIKTFVELIPSKKQNPKFIDQMGEYLPTELERINGLIKRLIDYAKPSDLNKTLVNVNDVITSCTVLTSNMLIRNNAVLNIEMEDNLKITADVNQLKQILINIILNGIEAMKEKNGTGISSENKLTMTIKAWSSKNDVYIQIADEGIGMDESERKMAAEPFFTTKSKGTGIGLAVTRQHVIENNGNMIIESEKNKYTKITLVFRR